MTSTPAKAFAAQLGMGAASPVTERYEFLSTTLAARTTIVQSGGIRGTRSKYSHRVRKASEAVNGNIVMNPSATEIDLLLPRILGGSTAGGVTTVADALTAFYICVDKVSKVCEYDGCVVSRAVFSGSPGQPLQLSLDIEGTSETEAAAGTFPALSIDTDNMFVFSDLTFKLPTTSIPISSFSLTIDNALETNRFLNSLTRTEIPALDRSVTVDVSMPYTTDNMAYYTSAKAATAQVGALVMADGSSTYTVALPALQANASGPDVPSKAAELMLSLSFEALRTAAATEVTFTKT